MTSQNVKSLGVERSRHAEKAKVPDCGHVVGYRIVRNGQDLGTVDATSRYESGLGSGTYNYEVYAVDDDGNRSSASIVTLTL